MNKDFPIPKKLQRNTASHKLVCGFSIIELLIVVALIGIVVTMAIPQLKRSHTGAGETVIIASLKAVRAEASLYHQIQDNSSYKGVCANESDTETPFRHSLGQIAAQYEATYTCSDGEESYVAVVTRGVINGPTELYCLDGTGFAGKISTLPVYGSLYCPR